MSEFRISVKSFIVDNNKLLILKRNSNNVQCPSIWEIPGGRLNLGEDPIEGLKRETREETGIEVDVLHPLNIRHFTRDDNQTITMLIFLCKLNNNKDFQLSEEHSDFEWIDLKNCKEKLTDFFHKEVDIFNKIGFDKFL